jgi:hypothetical protein
VSRFAVVVLDVRDEALDNRRCLGDGGLQVAGRCQPAGRERDRDAHVPGLNGLVAEVIERDSRECQGCRETYNGAESRQREEEKPVVGLRRGWTRCAMVRSGDRRSEKTVSSLRSAVYGHPR